MNLLLYVLLVDSSIKIKIKGGGKSLGCEINENYKKNVQIQGDFDSHVKHLLGKDI